MPAPWVGFDLDGTLAKLVPPYAPGVIGPPVPAMVQRCREHLEHGDFVKVFTARASPNEFLDLELRAIHEWTQRHIGTALPATAVKDFYCAYFYDDRARQVEHNTGRVIGE
jgi:hypothetical protein